MLWNSVSDTGFSLDEEKFDIWNFCGILESSFLIIACYKRVYTCWSAIL